ncbi:hypothetical protein NPIL_70951 [Nephila pilipes]|uniref:Uncharacterized protein n=1 Tax=Nephila pilipes TaxID=299642 RepID=A0A8X6MUP2_NEPPI|nr:hypothetical protein NPIL_70951 [Nephila pilipes]
MTPELEPTSHTWRKTILFADESKFYLFHSDGQCYVWLKTNQDLQEQNLRTTVKQGGGSIIVRVCQWSRKFLIIDAPHKVFNHNEIMFATKRRATEN